MSTHAGTTRAHVPARLAHRPNPPPVPLTPLVGRERELALAAGLLRRDDVRLLTITGPGGIGKTRLAVELARLEGEPWSGDVVFASLATVTDPLQVAPAVVRALGAQDLPGVAGRDHLVAVLRESGGVLVLDNFEHVLAAAPLLTDVLAACPDLKIVVTSRALLRVSGEFALPVPPLGLQSPHPRQEAAAGGGSAAVRLFIDRALAVAPDLAMTDDTTPVVTAICRHLDGLPLAIELAAAQVAVLPLPALLARVQARLPLPVTGPRDAPARLRTISDAVAWSYDLLPADEQELFRRISVFAGGFALDAAERIAAPDALDGLAALVEKSLLRQDAWEGEARFSMLETIRAFAWDRAQASDDMTVLRDAHAAWVMSLAGPALLAASLPGQEPLLRRLEVEHANLVAALAWLETRGDTAKLMQLAGSLSGYWLARGHFREGRDWLERALSTPSNATAHARGRAHIGLGRILALFGETGKADRQLAEGIALLDLGQDAPIIAFALVHRGAVANQGADHLQAERHIAAAHALAETIGDVTTRATIGAAVEANLGVVAHGRGDLLQARAYHESALRAYQDLGYSLGVARSCRDLGDVHRDLGDFAEALACYRNAIDLPGDHRDLRVVVDALEGTALVAAAWQEPVRAARFLGAAEALRELWGGAFALPADREAHARVVAAIRANLDEKATRLAWRDGRGIPMSEAIREIRDLTPPGTPVQEPVTAARFTPRELDVLRLLIVGESDRAIAEALFISVRTVEAHVGHILAKFGVRTRTAAAGAAVAAGLFESHPDRS